MTAAIAHMPVNLDWETRFPGAVHFDEPAASRTSMGVGGSIDLLLCPQSIVDLGEMVRLLNREKTPYAVVGNWTNLIITDEGYRGCLICTQGLNRLQLFPENSDKKTVMAEAGVALTEVVALTVRENLTGFEFGAGIPGSVGGAVRMNAGAYGHSLAEPLDSVTVMDRTGRLSIKPRDELHFSYRDLALLEGTVIVEATFLFHRDPEMQVATRVKDILAERRHKHPLQYAGSIFKNPPDRPAGRLIEEAGLKGFAIGDAMVSEMHGNFIVNRGQATAHEILAVIRHVQEHIAREMNIRLELEVKILGEQQR
jgi:UDP-N-acetylmuramate dehydrogenase